MQGVVLELGRKTPADINWQRIGKSGAVGVMLEAGIAEKGGELKFYDYVRPCALAAQEAGLEIGLAVYALCGGSFAANAAARRLSSFASELERELGERMKLPFAFAMLEKSKNSLIGQGRDGLTDTALAFLFELGRSGNTGCICTDSGFADAYLDMGRLSKSRIWMLDSKGEGFMRRLSPADPDYIGGLGEYRQSLIFERD